MRVISRCERGREPPEPFFLGTLRTCGIEEGRRLRTLREIPQTQVQVRVIITAGSQKPSFERLDDGIDERAVGVAHKKGVEALDIYRHHNLKKGGMSGGE